MSPPPGFEWDVRKAKQNLAKHGISFAEAVDFDFESALELDVQTDDQEERFVAIGPIGQKLFTLVYAFRRENIRIISLRKATAREARRFRQGD